MIKEETILNALLSNPKVEQQWDVSDLMLRDENSADFIIKNFIIIIKNTIRLVLMTLLYCQLTTMQKYSAKFSKTSLIRYDKR